MTSLPRATFSSFGLLIVWGLVIGSGMLLFETYSFQPGPRALHRLGGRTTVSSHETPIGRRC